MKQFDFLLWGSAGVIALFYFALLIVPTLLAHEALKTMAETMHEMVHLIWMSVLMGMVMVALLSRVPRIFVMHALGDQTGLSSVVRAAIGGVLLDLCNHGILMIAAKLYERGASIGQVIAFLIASPWNSFSLMLILIALIGFWWMVLFIVLSMVIAILSGWSFDYFVRRGVLPKNPHQFSVPEGFRFWREARQMLRDAHYNWRVLGTLIVDGWRESRMVLRWVFFGIVLTGLVRVLLSPELFADWFGPTLFGLFMTLIAATVIEVCSEGSVPLASDFISRAQAPGNSFTFLMAGASTDYTEIVILHEATRSWKIALFLPLVTVPQVMLFGWLMNVFSVAS